MARHVANKDFGQHFLVDENILRVIERLADLAPEDVVLEIGPGLGALTVYLAARVARVHLRHVSHLFHKDYPLVGEAGGRGCRAAHRAPPPPPASASPLRARPST